LNKLDLLYDALTDKLWSQHFYNEQFLMIVNPIARNLFARLRDEESQHVLTLHRAIAAMEANPFPPSRILPGLNKNPRYRL
jgi:rubrerythrin